jgi:hypothetical protein
MSKSCQLLILLFVMTLVRPNEVSWSREKKDHVNCFVLCTLAWILKNVLMTLFRILVYNKVLILHSILSLFQRFWRFNLFFCKFVDLFQKIMFIFIFPNCTSNFLFTHFICICICHIIVPTFSFLLSH